MRYMSRAVPAMQILKKTYITCLLSENVECIMREGLKMHIENIKGLQEKSQVLTDFM